MYKTLFTVTFDAIFCGICSFFIVFCLVNYFLPLKTSLIIAVFVAIIFATACLFILKSIRQTAFLNKKERQLKQKIIDNLCFLPRFRQAEELAKCYRINKQNTTIYDGYFTTESEVVYANFSFRTLDKEDVASVKRQANSNLTAYEQKKQLKIVIYGNDFNDVAIKTCVLLGVTHKNCDDVFQLFKSTGYYPKTEVEVENARFDFKSFLKNAFDRKKAKTYFLSGASLLFLSFLTPFKIYYITFGTILIILSIIAKFITPKN